MTENESKYGKIEIVGGCRNSGRILKAHIELLEELEAYKRIGTIDEFKALKEKKQKKKQSKSNKVIYSHDSYAYCPHCKHSIELLWPSHCDKCGGELDWK